MEDRFHSKKVSEPDSIIHVVLVLLHDSRKPLRPAVDQENRGPERTLYEAVKVISLDCTGDPKILVPELRDIYLEELHKGAEPAQKKELCSSQQSRKNGTI